MKRMYKFAVGPMVFGVKAGAELIAIAIANNNPMIEELVGNAPGSWLRDVADPNYFKWVPKMVFEEVA